MLYIALKKKKIHSVPRFTETYRKNHQSTHYHNIMMKKQIKINSPVHQNYIQLEYTNV